jgi:Tol biopolymer transport system component
MAFVKVSQEGHLWALELDANGQPTGPAAKVFASSRSEYHARFSPDGRKVVFQSARSGHDLIWVCETGGANCFPASPPGRVAGNPDWSPDGKWLAFSMVGDSGTEIELVPSGGGKPKLLTRGAPELQGATTPRWSRNGQWIYFHCGGRAQICRIPWSGGEAHPVRGAEGFFPEESSDGRWIYFSTGTDLRPGRLKRVPVSGGEASEIISQVAGRNWGVTATGLFYMAPPPTINGSSDLKFLDTATGATRTIFHTEKSVMAGFTISRDQHRIIFSQGEKAIGEADIMLVENFR